MSRLRSGVLSLSGKFFGVTPVLWLVAVAAAETGHAKPLVAFSGHLVAFVTRAARFSAHSAVLQTDLLRSKAHLAWVLLAARLPDMSRFARLFLAIFVAECLKRVSQRLQSLAVNTFEFKLKDVSEVQTGVKYDEKGPYYPVDLYGLIVRPRAFDEHGQPCDPFTSAQDISGHVQEAAILGSHAETDLECKYTLAIATREGRRVGTASRVQLPSGGYALLTAAHVLSESRHQPCVLTNGAVAVDFDRQWELLFYSPPANARKRGCDVALIDVPGPVWSALQVRAIRVGAPGSARMRAEARGYGPEGSRLRSRGDAFVQKNAPCLILHGASTEASWSGGPLVHDGKVVGVHTGFDPISGRNTAACLAPFLSQLESSAASYTNERFSVVWEDASETNSVFTDDGHGPDVHAWGGPGCSVEMTLSYDESGVRGRTRKGKPRDGGWGRSDEEWLQDPSSWANMEAGKPGMFRRLACLAATTRVDGEDDDSECFPLSAKTRAGMKALQLESGRGASSATSKVLGKAEAAIVAEAAKAKAAAKAAKKAALAAPVVSPPVPPKGESGSKKPPRRSPVSAASKKKPGKATTASVPPTAEMLEWKEAVRRSLVSVPMVLEQVRLEQLAQRISHWEASCAKLQEAVESQRDPDKREPLTQRHQALLSSKPTRGLLAEPVLSEILSLFTALELQSAVSLLRRRMNSARE